MTFMRTHHDGIPYRHIKSVDRGIRAEVAVDGIPFADAVRMGAFTSPKDGVIDSAAFRQVLDDIGFDGIGIVEQNPFPTAFDRPYRSRSARVANCQTSAQPRDCMS